MFQSQLSWVRTWFGLSCDDLQLQIIAKIVWMLSGLSSLLIHRCSPKAETSSGNNDEHWGDGDELKHLFAMILFRILEFSLESE